jgi:multidrug efflux pump subunit AcrB
MNHASTLRFAGKLGKTFLQSKLTIVLVVTSVLLGVFSTWLLPREEEPQIQVPMVDVLVRMSGASAAEIENQVTRPMEKLLWEVPGVEYLYSTSSPGEALLIVRYQVGTNLEGALVRLDDKLRSNADRIPPGVSAPLVKPRGIDDVPVLALTFHSKTSDHLTLRRLVQQVEEEIKILPKVAETQVIGGLHRQVRVQLDRVALTAHGISPETMMSALSNANQQQQFGSLPQGNREVLVETGGFLHNHRDVEMLVVGAHAGRPVYLRDVAKVLDGAEDPTQYVFHGAGAALLAKDSSRAPIEAAVTLSVAKRPGANAVDVVHAVRDTVERLRGKLLPADVDVSITRDYGATAAEKSNELLLHMGIAVFGVTVLILLFLGWRESLVVLLAIPSTLALTLFVFFLYGYTLNRITLFALIFSIGILVDDAIVVVENIVRHARGPRQPGDTLAAIAVRAVDEVGNPTLLATWAVIAAILPMAFVGGMMGPYMRPIPVGASAAMLFSVLVAFTVTPWAALRVLRRHFDAPAGGHEHSTSEGSVPDDWSTRLYFRIMRPLLSHRVARWGFLGGIVMALMAAMSLVRTGHVKVKMLPFDNKSELNIVVNTPEGTTLEDTTQVALELGSVLREVPSVRDYQIYAGTASPFNFNGLVRHYYMRRGPNMADIQVNLVEKDERTLKSHDVAKALRSRLAAIAEKHGANLVVAEVPPGPPVLQTLVAEVYGPTLDGRRALATRVQDVMRHSPGVVDIDSYEESASPRIRWIVDKMKAAEHGLSEGEINRALQIATTGIDVALFHAPNDREQVPLRVELPRETRRSDDSILAMELESHAMPGSFVPLRELVKTERTVRDRSIYHKNLLPVTYVTTDVAGVVESPGYAIFQMQPELARLAASDFGGSSGNVQIYQANQPLTSNEPAIKWDGEWHVTLEVFRDLGIAFAVVLVLIYALMVGWFHSYVTPLVVMAAIPFSLIGILPGHWAMGAFFTATSMIGFMAGAGIVVRNSIILVDFIQLRRAQGAELKTAVLEAGAVRFRPMLLTALAVVVGASVILADPIFQGLAISLLFGEIASLLISRMAVPVLYFMQQARKEPALNGQDTGSSIPPAALWDAAPADA